MLNNRLDSLLQDGTLVSRGEFSLDLRGEALKMLKFQQQEPGLWLLKGVQAAVASGASEVRIRLSRRNFNLSFVPGPQAGQANLESEEHWCRQLRTALTLALASAPKSVTLSQGNKALLGPPCPDSLAQSGVHLFLQRPHRPWWNFSDPELASVACCLARRCAFCPIPVKIDGRDLLDPAPELSPLVRAARPKLSFMEGAQPISWLCESWSLAHDIPGFSLYSPGQRPSHELEMEGRRIPGRINNGFLKGDMIASIAWVGPPLQLHHLKAEKAGKVIQVIWAAEKIRAGSLGQLPGPDFLCLSFGLVRTDNSTHQVDDLVIAEVPSRQLVPQAANLARLHFPKPRCRIWMGLCSSGQALGGLFLVEDGVLLNPVLGWSSYPGTTAFVATSGQSTDLSQLSPVRDAALEGLLKQAGELEIELAQKIQGLLQSESECERMRVPLSTRELWRHLLF